MGRFLFLIFLTAAVLNIPLANAAVEHNPNLELQHIINCQVTDPQDIAYGAINNVWGEPTWVMPGEMAIAAYVLFKAGYVENARIACDYLVKIQNTDGSWCNQYDHLTATDTNKYSRHTAEAMILLGTVGGYDAALQKAKQWLLTLQDTANKSGRDDGLICGGQSNYGTYFSDRWTSDNSYAALAFHLAGDYAARDQIVYGINQYLLDEDYWFQKISSSGTQQAGTFCWINFAPAFMNLDRFGVRYPADLAKVIREKLQFTKGPNKGAVREYKGSQRLMPGIGFQASLAWQDVGALNYYNEHLVWAENVSRLW